MIDLNAELESAKSRISEINKSIISQTRVLRELSDRGMDKTLGERMLDVRRYYLGRTTAHAVLIEYQIATRPQFEKLSGHSGTVAELEINLA
jgi:hypothetical protein